MRQVFSTDSLVWIFLTLLGIKIPPFFVLLEKKRTNERLRYWWKFHHVYCFRCIEPVDFYCLQPVHRRIFATQPRPHFDGGGVGQLKTQFFTFQLISGIMIAFSTRRLRVRPSAAEHAMAIMWLGNSPSLSVTQQDAFFECLNEKGEVMALVLLIILVLLLLGAVPAWPYSRAWGYWPSGSIGTILLIVLILLLLGYV